MPSINRIRVNNVKYNFGTQYYDDFTMRMYGKNTLYDLANGGGKSVLMLLLMQNMIPNCTLDEKQPIEKLFRTGNGNTTIHSLVEWKLDEQDRKEGYRYMTTGFCARKAKDVEGETAKKDVAAIEYFNYCIFYREYNKNDIINLPLSKDKERITFQGLRNYLKELEHRDMSLKVCIFDRKGEYQRFISGYGLHESQWEIIRGINKTEGHVRTYFETNYKTTRKVVEDLLIEGIIEKAYAVKTMRDGEDSDTMAKMLMDIKEQLTILAKKKKDITSYDHQAELIEVLRDKVASFMSLYQEQTNMEKLLADICVTGEEFVKNDAETLEKLEQAEKTAEDKLAALLEQLRGTPQDDPNLNDAVVKAANDAESKRRQADAVNKLVDAGLAQNQAESGALIARAVSAAAERAEEVQTILGAWSDAPGDMRKTDANAALLERVRASKTLQDISRYLGRFREIFAQGKRNGYAYGRGEKYALELGNDLSRALTSELAMLAVPETLPLFLRKYQHRQIKQYRRREPVYKGAGDIICCLDESGSTAGDLAAWGKAVALTLLEIAQSEGRKFALVHFSGPGHFQTDVFLPGQFSLEEKLRAAETFLGGGTDFQTPLAEAERLMREDGFENADIAFITDGECSLPEICVETLQRAQSELRFTVTGILLDEGNAGMDFSLKPFCQNIYRTSELTGDQIVGEIVLDRV